MLVTVLVEQNFHLLLIHHSIPSYLNIKCLYSLLVKFSVFVKQNHPSIIKFKQSCYTIKKSKIPNIKILNIFYSNIFLFQKILFYKNIIFNKLTILMGKLCGRGIYIFNFIQICLFYKRPMDGQDVKKIIYYNNTCNTFILITKLNNLSSCLVENIVYYNIIWINLIYC